MPALDLWPILEQLTIRTKNAQIKNLARDDRFAWAQRAFVSQIEAQYNAGKPVRIIVLKGRQLGLSTLTEAVLFLWCFLHPGSHSLVISKEKDDAEYLFGITKRYWDDGPFKGLFNTKYYRQGYIEWDGLSSAISTSTALKADVGRGKTLQAVHGSEVAFWDQAEDIVAGLSESIPYEHGTIVVYESTAQGVGGFFHDEWTKAIEGRSEFVPMFFPWWEHDEYEVKNTALRYQDLDEEERDLLAAYPKMNYKKLAWRRRKLVTYTNPTTFKEEYPVCESEAFQATGKNVFALAKLAQCYNPPSESVPVDQGYLFNSNGTLKFEPDPSGHLFIYLHPDHMRKRQYAVAVDPTWTVEGDPACIQVLDRASLEQVAVWHGSADPETIGDIALGIALYYGPETILNTEIQGGGRRVLQVWRAHNYTRIWYDRRPDRPKQVAQTLCWNSTYETKNWMLSTMKGLVNRTALRLHHPATYYELTRYIANEDGTYGPSRRSGHDDCVTSLGVALMTVVTESHNLDWQALAAPPQARMPGISQPRFEGQAVPYAPAWGAGPGLVGGEDVVGVIDWY